MPVTRASKQMTPLLGEMLEFSILQKTKHFVLFTSFSSNITTICCQQRKGLVHRGKSLGPTADMNIVTDFMDTTEFLAFFLYPHSELSCGIEKKNQESLKCLNNADKSDQFILNCLAYFMKIFCQNLLWTLYYTRENIRRRQRYTQKLTSKIVLITILGIQSQLSLYLAKVPISSKILSGIPCRHKIN